MHGHCFLWTLWCIILDCELVHLIVVGVIRLRIFMEVTDNYLSIVVILSFIRFIKTLAYIDATKLFRLSLKLRV